MVVRLCADHVRGENSPGSKYIVKGLIIKFVGTKISNWDLPVIRKCFSMSAYWIYTAMTQPKTVTTNF